MTQPFFLSIKEVSLKRNNQFMKVLALILVLVLVFCDDFRTFHYNGTMQINGGRKTAIEGPFFIGNRMGRNLTIITGMITVRRQHTYFDFTSEITKFSQDNDRIELEAKCVEVTWDGKMYNGLEGKVIIAGTTKDVKYFSNCTLRGLNIKWEIGARGKETNCTIFSPSEAAKWAQLLVGNTAAYHAIHVVNFATMGYPYLPTIKHCSWWLQHFKDATESQPGFVIVGKDGEHCAIIDQEGDKFIHENPVRGEVTANPLSMLKTYFPKGYLFKDYRCQPLLRYYARVQLIPIKDQQLVSIICTNLLSSSDLQWVLMYLQCV
eukprot:TRINITY_DN965_c0_g1_i1.p1 TRINITY_DN965_c0_g1~~TRINITY_DN965_c0_g1_i1.p1  ORF type:complete len:354 (+),score=14.22 TRINITY_DN965_c0_g1_i1:103-1062(+)